MKRALAVAFALALAGCASDPYYAGGYTSYSYGTPYYSYGYGTPYYYDYYPGPAIGGSITYYHFDNDRDRWRHRDRDWHGRDGGRDRGRDYDRGRGRDDRPSWRDGGTANFRHGEAGNEAGM
jgi:hypothetical protein